MVDKPSFQDIPSVKVLNRQSTAACSVAELTHVGSVDLMNTPKVQYSYASGSSNTIRMTGMTYPDGRGLSVDYGTAGDKQRKPPSEERGCRLEAVAMPGHDIWNKSSGQTAAPLSGYDELYQYDGLQRLKDQKRGTLNSTHTAITSSTFQQQWGLDATGNWSSFKQDDDGSGSWDLVQSRSANKVNEITSISNSTGTAWNTPLYDPAGNMIGIPNGGATVTGTTPAWVPFTESQWTSFTEAQWSAFTEDTGTTPQQITAQYDAWNRLVKVITTPLNFVEHLYDGRGFRIGRQTNVNNTVTADRHYYYTPGWQCVEERVGSVTTAERQFVWGLRYIDDLVIRDRSTTNNGTINERRYAMQDGNWNTIAICDTTGSVGERYAYSAYGAPVFMTGAGVVQSASTIGFETLYAGYRWDNPAPQMYYVRNRFLLPQVGTWNRRDPLKVIGELSKLYEYLSANPMTAVDPTGLWKFMLGPEGQIFAVAENGDTWQSLISQGYRHLHPESPNDIVLAGTYVDVSIAVPVEIQQALRDQQTMVIETNNELWQYYHYRAKIDVNRTCTVGTSGIEWEWNYGTSYLWSGGNCHGMTVFFHQGKFWESETYSASQVAVLGAASGREGFGTYSRPLTLHNEDPMQGGLNKVFPEGILPKISSTVLGKKRPPRLGDTLVCFLTPNEISHSAIILGVDRSGQPYVLQKFNSNLPYGITPTNSPLLVPFGKQKIFAPPQ